MTFSGQSSCVSAVYPGCVYRGGWRVSTCSPSPAGMQRGREMAHRQVLKEGQRSKNEREPAISTSPIKVLHVLMQYFRSSLHTRPLPPLTLAPQVASSPVWTFFSFREMRSQLSWADPCCFLQIKCKKQELITLFCGQNTVVRWVL